MINRALYNKLKILIVEDSRVYAPVLKSMLSRIGVTDMSFVTDGEQAVEKLRTSAFDLVFMDLHMPIMDGIEATRQIRMALSDYETPIVAVTSQDSVKARDEAIFAGISGILLKPVNAEDLREALNTHVPFLRDLTLRGQL